MPIYVYNVVYRGKKNGVIRKAEPESFPGSARDFAREKLLTWMAENAAHEPWLVVVNVWDATREGLWDGGRNAAQLSNHELDEGPFDPDQIQALYLQYYILSAGYSLFEVDPLFRPEGLEQLYRLPYGLIAPGQGPGLQIRTGHEGWISLKVALGDAEPAADLERWEAAEQVTIRPAGEVRIAGITEKVEDHYPDLRNGSDAEYLAIRVSARGRDRPEPVTALNPRRTTVEEHLVEAWPVAGPAPRAVLKRDECSRRLENSSRLPGRKGHPWPEAR